MQKNTSGADSANPIFSLLDFPKMGSSVSYALPMKATADDIADYLDARLQQLDAMLSMAYGGGGEAFRRYNDTIQDNYLWACSMMAKECLEMVRQFTERRG